MSYGTSPPAGMLVRWTRPVNAGPKARTDGCTCGLATLAAACHVVTTCARAGQRGRLREPVCAPHPMLIYGQLIIQEQPSKLLMLRTALIDRLNLTMRHVLALLVRVTASVCKDWEPTPRRVVFVQAFCNVAWAHRSLRVPWPEGTPPAAEMIQLQWDRKPMMAAGITDQIWNFRELLTVKCKPLDSQSISGCAPKKPAKRIYDRTGLRIVTQYRCGGVRF
jgi:hypothetical protein